MVKIDNIVIYSNCQGLMLKFFLEKILKNSKFYFLENYSMISNKSNIPIDILKKCNLVIYQPIDKKYGVYSTDNNNFFKYLKNDTIKIAFPYIFNNSLWDLKKYMVRDNQNINYHEKHCELIKYKINNEDVIVNLLNNRKLSLNELIDLYNLNKINFNYNERYQECIKILKEKEKICNINVSDYIENNIQNKRLFLTFNHPTSCVIIHCVNQILRLLNINFIFNENDYPEKVVEQQERGFYTYSNNDMLHWKFLYNEKFDNDETVNLIKEIYNNYKN